MQDFNLLHLLFPECFPLILASSVCKSLQCLICALMQWGQRWPLTRLTCSVVWWEGRYTANKYCWHVWGVLTVDGPHWVCHSPRRCVLPRSALLSLQGALQGHCSNGPCISCTSQVYTAQVFGCSTRAQTQMCCAFCTLPRFKQPRQPDALWTHCPRWAICLIHLPSPHRLVSQMCCESRIPGVPCVSSWELISGCDNPHRLSTVKVLRKRRLATGTLLTVWCKMQSLGPRLQQPLVFRLWLSHVCFSASGEGGLSFGICSIPCSVSTPRVTIWR